MNKEIDNQMPCKEKRCGSDYVKRGIVLQGTTWNNFTIQCKGILQIFLNKRDMQRTIDFMM